MKIGIKTVLPIPEMPSVVEMEAGTLQDLFLKIFKQVHFSNQILNEQTGEFKDDSIFEARLNGVSYYNLPKGLDTELTDGDTVTLSFLMIGGG
jgi:hypothetical protein